MRTRISTISLFCFFLPSLFSATGAQAQYVISSKTGYQVSIELTFDSISVANGGCSGGWYNYNLHYTYDIQFTGTNIPNNLWTLQAYVIADDGNHFIPLPNNGGASTAVSGSNVTRGQSDCSTATPASLGCDSVRLVINGPGISSQTIGLNTTALPVTLLNFDANLIDDQVEVSWTTSLEENNASFTVEESTNGKDFYAVKQVEGAGNSMHLINYAVLLDFRYDHPTYYRLKQTDFDGSFSYSQIRVVHRTSNASALAFPNPSSSKNFTLRYGTKTGSYRIDVVSSNGQTINSFHTNLPETSMEALARGFYLIEITDLNAQKKQVVRFIQN
ncbi:MAG: T9SS type A sorting domain-containing protein [Bacteroidia bacterium]|nr:T9SS type A sorting domain-containing protein [Bacteroidia bacterium]